MIDNINHHWHAIDKAEISLLLDTHLEHGLKASVVESRLKEYGLNRLSSVQSKSAFVRFLLQFHNPIVYILIVSGFVAFFLKKPVDSVVIFGVVILNAIIGFIQESKAKAALDALEQMVFTETTVVRDGVKERINADRLVIGDVVLLQSGDKVPADLRLVEAIQLKIDESVLTGESVASDKSEHLLEANTILADRTNMAYAGTLVVYGHAKGVVVAVGDSTETGKIAHLIRSADDAKTPLTIKIEHFSRFLLRIILLMAMATMLVGYLRGGTFGEMFLAAVALSVAAIPEGLPAVITITLAIGVSQMARRGAIIRKLSAVETLGSTTVICSDKTGTLTENRMTVCALWSANGKLIRVSGNGYHLIGGFEELDPQNDDALSAILRAGVLCSDAVMDFSAKPEPKLTGDPTEGALLVVAKKAGYDYEAIRTELPRIDVVPFESDRQYMAVLVRDATGEQIIIKGAVERVLALCSEVDSAAVLKQVDALASEGLRVLAFAMRRADMNETLEAALERGGLLFLGLVGMIDPPRAEAVEAIKACHNAGITVKMITGDHAKTAEAIGVRLGLAAPGSRVFTGAELESIDENDLREVVLNTNIFARVAPEQKLRIVNALQSHGEIVAMTGDGVNDAPALKQANIGVAMGIAGTEVAKEAADMVLLDDNFATIAAAVHEGRGVFDNLVKFIAWILPTNIGQGLVILTAVFLGVALPILPTQVLWINMTTAVFLGLMLAFEPKEPNAMQRPPRAPDAPIIDSELMGRIVVVSMLLVGGSFGLYELALIKGYSEAVARTVAVNVFIVGQSFYLFNCRHLERFRLFSEGNPWLWVGIGIMALSQAAFVYWPPMNHFFHSASVPAETWLWTLGLGLLIFVTIEGKKILWRRIKRI